MTLSRRQFLKLCTSSSLLLAAPAIVSATSLMKIRPVAIEQLVPGLALWGQTTIRTGSINLLSSYQPNIGELFVNVNTNEIMVFNGSLWVHLHNKSNNRM